MSDECEALFTCDGMRTSEVDFDVNGTKYKITVGLNDPNNSCQHNTVTRKRRQVRRVCCTNTWECGACTYENREALPSCEICGTARGGYSYKPAPATNATATTPATKPPLTPAAPVKQQRGFKRHTSGTKQLDGLANIPTTGEFWISTYLNTLMDDALVDDSKVREVVYQMYKYFRVKHPVEHVDHSKLEQGGKCSTCLVDFGGSVTPAHLSAEAGGNNTICVDCLRAHLTVKIEEESVTPWICSPCLNFTSQPLSAGNVLLLWDAYPNPNHAAQNRKLILNFIKLHCRQRAQQELKDDFVVCDKCEFGVCKSSNPTIHDCPNCLVPLPVVVIDDTMQKMLDDGSMRKAPCCGQLHVKQHGVCNIIQCQACNMFFNWSSNDVGKDSKVLKQKARQANTLWQPGEQEFQANLAATDKQAFIKLLEDNGVKYDPNYVPGQD